jgi:hypothetical protein
LTDVCGVRRKTRDGRCGQHSQREQRLFHAFIHAYWHICWHIHWLACSDKISDNHGERQAQKYESDNNRGTDQATL